MPLLSRQIYILALIHAEHLKHVPFSVSDNDWAPPGGSAKTVWREAGESFGECPLINLPKDAEGRTWRGCTVGASPPGFMSAQHGEPLVQPEALRRVFVFLKQGGRNLGRAVCALPRCSCRLLWLTRLTPGRCITSPSGEVVILPAGEERNTFWQRI